MTSRHEDPSAEQATSDAGTTTMALVQRRYGAPGGLTFEPVPMPQPEGDEVLVQVGAASVNSRDWHIMRGEPRIARLMAPGIFGMRAPRVTTRGTDLAGVVVAAGPDVTRWSPGDLVFGEGSGTFAEHAVASSGQLAAIPEGVGFDVAAAIPLAGTTAWEILEAADASPGMRILINGASGGVGTFALQLAHARGLHVTAVASPRNLAQATSLGADDTVDYTRNDFTVGARSYDVVLDLVGNRSLGDLRRIVRPDGAIVLSGGGVPGQGSVLGPMPMLVRAQLAPRRSGVRVLTPQPTPSTDVLERLAELVASGRLAPVIDRRFSLDRAADAIDYMETQHTRGKVVLIP